MRQWPSGARARQAIICVRQVVYRQIDSPGEPLPNKDMRSSWHFDHLRSSRLMDSRLLCAQHTIGQVKADTSLHHLCEWVGKVMYELY